MSAALAHAPRGFVLRADYDRVQRQLDEARERLAYFEAEKRFEEDAAATGPALWKLTPVQAFIVRLLCARSLLTRSVLVENWPTGPEPHEQSCDVFISQIRARLAPFGIRIETVRTRGWKLDRETRAFVRRAMEGDADTETYGPAVAPPGPSKRPCDADLQRGILERLEERRYLAGPLRRALSTSHAYFAPVRDRMEEEGLIEIRRSRRCLFHTITEAGRARLIALREQDAPAAETEGRNGSSH
ncbi:helix-turn-helix domain-containing protein [Oceanicaulis alexandrii]|uniref:helix-turn-helix domain-containing protein n=1 Tax=Oceanicaulis alexandrii TaxID=153233 RepID=UPI0035D0D8E2